MIRRLVRVLAVTGAVGFVGLNLLAWRHAAAFTRFATSGSPTAKPHELGLGEKLWVLVAGPRVPRPVNRRTPKDLGLPFTTHRFPGFDGIALEAWHVPAAVGRGTVVLFHGHADCKASVLPAARALHRMGWSTLLVDFHGSGGSAGDRTSIGFHEARDVARAFEYAGRLEAGPRVLYGPSMGAVAILKAVNDERLAPDGIVLECPFDELPRTVERRFHALGAPAFPAAPILLFWGGVEGGFDPFAFRPVDDAAGVTSPLLVLHGDADPYITVDEVRAIVGRAKGPARLEVFAGLGHQSYVAARPKLWNRVVRDFLDGLGARMIPAP